MHLWSWLILNFCGKPEDVGFNITRAAVVGSDRISWVIDLCDIFLIVAISAIIFARALSAAASSRRHSQKKRLCSVESSIDFPTSSQIEQSFDFLTFTRSLFSPLGYSMMRWRTLSFRPMISFLVVAAVTNGMEVLSWIGEVILKNKAIESAPEDAAVAVIHVIIFYLGLDKVLENILWDWSWCQDKLCTWEIILS